MLHDTGTSYRPSKLGYLINIGRLNREKRVISITAGALHPRHHEHLINMNRGLDQENKKMGDQYKVSMNG